MAWTELARAVTPDGDALTLRQCGADFEIRLNLLELMSSRNPVSERMLAQAVCKRLARRNPRILIGGLGMGYTVRAVLDHVGDGAGITVAELMADIIAWNHGPLAAVAGRPLDDHRVTVCNSDVADVVRASPDAFDAILLDVDNGPEAVLFPSNRFLYRPDGVKAIVSALRTDGVFALWSADRSPAFEQVLAAGALPAECVEVAVCGGNTIHTIYLVAAR
ncbi:MAG: hypothetical protein KGJ78_03295 [Alphaproteobacteria bacterium]|nr:hypothetical protein [Alphaproteobacteria bacterium]